MYRLRNLNGVVPSFALLCLVVTTAHAQRGMGGMGRRGAAPGILRDPGIAVPKLVNPVNLLVEHRPELALSDSQFARIIALKRTLDSTNAPLLRRIDSVERLFRGRVILGEQSREHRDSVAEGRIVVQEMSAGLRDNYAQAKEQAFALLDAQQHSKAEDLYGKAEQAIIDEEQKAKRRS